MKKLAIFITLISLSFCKGQKEKTYLSSSLSKDDLAIIYEHCPEADIVEVESSNSDYTEIEYFCDGVRYEIGIKDKKLIYREFPIKKSDVNFEKIEKKLDKNYKDWSIDEFSKIITKDTNFIKVEILKDGIEQNTYFTENGKWYKIRPIDVSSTFDFNLIQKNKTYQKANYSLHNPSYVSHMPKLLREISGIVITDNNTIFCVQDELGTVFEYDLKEEKIISSHRFTDIGDFEDLAINKQTIYILRSDGNIFIYDLNNKTSISQAMLQTNSLDNEGLFYQDGYLYLACKEAEVTSSENTRMIYRTPVNHLDEMEAFLEIDNDEIETFVKDNYPEIDLKSFEFNPSALAFHPFTKELYVLSASDRFIAIFKNKNLHNVFPLSSEIYYQPEGLSFDDKGNMYISSEGDKKGYISGSIQQFKYQSNK